MIEKASESLKEKVEKMSNRELGYKLAEWLMQGYHTGGHSADRSLRSSIIRLFFDLNEDVSKSDISINNNYELIDNLFIRRIFKNKFLIKNVYKPINTYISV